jgi:hypothetical protein
MDARKVADYLSSRINDIIYASSDPSEWSEEESEQFTEILHNLLLNYIESNKSETAEICTSENPS